MMKFDEVYNMFNSTFATKKDDDDSFYAFRRMLHEFGLIDDALYLSLAIDDEDRAQNESLCHEYYYFVNEGDIPTFDNFVSHEFGFKSDVIRTLSNINHVIIVNEDGDEILYNKIVDDSGIPGWEKIMGNSKVTEIDMPEIVSIICKYIVDMQYNYKVNDDYMNINVTKFNNGDEEVSDLIKTFSSWYKKIFDVESVEDDNWGKFLSFIEDAGIISSMDRSRIVSSDSTTASF